MRRDDDVVEAVPAAPGFGRPAAGALDAVSIGAHDEAVTGEQGAHFVGQVRRVLWLLRADRSSRPVASAARTPRSRAARTAGSVSWTTLLKVPRARTTATRRAMQEPPMPW